MFGPMTMIVVLALVVCFVAGMVILSRGGTNGASLDPKRCPRCQCANPRRARYCAGCGQKFARPL